MLDFNNLSFARRTVVWQGALTLMLLYVSKELDMSLLADKMASTFQAAVR